MNTKLMKLAKLVMNFAETKVGDAVWIHEGEDLAVGTEVLVEDENGEMVPVEDGEYMLDGNKITIKDGKVEEIEAKEEPEPAEPAAEPEDMRKPCGLEEEPEPAAEPAPAEDKDAKIAELEGLLQDRDAIIEELTAKVKELEDKLAAPKEEPVQMNKVTPSIYAKVDKSVNPALKYFED